MLANFKSNIEAINFNFHKNDIMAKKMNDCVMKLVTLTRLRGNGNS